MVDLLADRDPAARLGGRGALRQHDLTFTQLANKLFRIVFLLGIRRPFRDLLPGNWSEFGEKFSVSNMPRRDSNILLRSWTLHRRLS